MRRLVAVAAITVLPAGLLLTSACSGADSGQPDPERLCGSWQTPSRGIVLIDLDYDSPLASWYQLEPGGRFPAFTLYSSGFVVWGRVGPATDSNAAPWRLYQARLTPAEVHSLCRQFVAAGGPALSERDETIDDREFDRAWAVVRFKSVEGVLVTRRVYTGEPVRSPEWRRVEKLLVSFSHPREREFEPAGGTLFLSSCPGCEEGKVWPLSPQLLGCLSSTASRGSVRIGREDLQLLVPNRTWNPGQAIYESSGMRFAVAVVPEVSDQSESDAPVPRQGKLNSQVGAFEEAN